MILRIDKKFAEILGIKEISDLPPHPNPYADWTLTTFKCNGELLLLLANTATMYCMILPMPEISSYNKFIQYISEFMKEFLNDDGYDYIFEEVMEQALGNVTIAHHDMSTKNSISNAIKQACKLIKEYGCSYFETSIIINSEAIAELNDENPRAVFMAMFEDAYNLLNARNQSDFFKEFPPEKEK